MGAAISTPSLSAFPAKGSSDDFDATGFQAALNAWCAPHRLECGAPFLVKWYNDARSETAGGTQRIEAADTAVCFALYSVPGYLEVVADYYRSAKPESGHVDAATNEILERLRADLPPELDALVVNTDVGPPYYHVQTIGCVAAIDQHIEACDITGPDAEQWREDLSDKLEDSRDTKMWGTDPATLRKIFAVNVHPVWGGWYAYRSLVILRGAQAPGLPKPQPLRFLPQEDAKRIISEYNLRHQECLWRDLSLSDHPPDRRYTTDEFFFFTETSTAKRTRWLALRTAQKEKASAGLGGIAVRCCSSR